MKANHTRENCPVPGSQTLCDARQWQCADCGTSGAVVDGIAQPPSAYPSVFPRGSSIGSGPGHDALRSIGALPLPPAPPSQLVTLRLIGGPLCGMVRQVKPEEFDRDGYAYFTAVVLYEQWVDVDQVPRDGQSRSCVVYRTDQVCNFPALGWSVRMAPLKASFVRRTPV